jgi:hypothetical protein
MLNLKLSLLDTNQSLPAGSQAVIVQRPVIITARLGTKRLARLRQWLYGLAPFLTGRRQSPCIRQVTKASPENPELPEARTKEDWSRRWRWRVWLPRDWTSNRIGICLQPYKAQFPCPVQTRHSRESGLCHLYAPLQTFLAFSDTAIRLI